MKMIGVGLALLLGGCVPTHDDVTDAAGDAASIAVEESEKIQALEGEVVDLRERVAVLEERAGTGE